MEDENNITKINEKYSMTIENFEGPLDLLCFLISKNKMDVFDISLSELTDKYIEYLNEMQELDLDIATEFLVMASSLLYIKSKKLLPASEPKEEEIEEMTEEDILNRIIEYKKYKEKLNDFQDMYKANFGTFEKEPEKIKVKRVLSQALYIPISEFSEIYKNIINKNINKINKKSKEVEEIVTYEKVTIKSKVKQILDIFKKKTSFVFNKVYNGDKNKRIDTVTAFLSILELSRLKRVSIEQKGMFEDIVVKKKDVTGIDLSLINE